MFRVTNYHNQYTTSLGLDQSEQTFLRLVDRVTFLREAAKAGAGGAAVMAFIATALHQKEALIFATIYMTANGIAWLISRTCAKPQEPVAQRIIDKAETRYRKRNMSS